MIFSLRASFGFRDSDMSLTSSGNDPPVTPIQVTCSLHFPSWLAERRVSLAVSTYQAGKLFLLGLKPDGQLSVFNRTFKRCLGLGVDPLARTLWMTSEFQIWRFEKTQEPIDANGFDALYVPRIGYTTGAIDAHDIALMGDARPVFVNTLFSCLATVGDSYSFAPLWRPPFVSRLAAEDRCHLNGLAMADGQPGYVTACSQSDAADGWRDVRDRGGCVVDVRSNEIVLDGLSMPHSPRIHRDRLYLLDSGHGQFGWVDRATGRFEPVAFCPGYGRGLALVGDWAVIGLSRAREATFTGLALDTELSRRRTAARCGLQVVDLRTGDAVHWVRFDGGIDELYDVVILPEVKRPKALGFQTDEIRRQVSFVDDAGKVHTWTAQER
jgi:uncharacterized protein (TIGR03032 family)